MKLAGTLLVCLAGLIAAGCDRSTQQTTTEETQPADLAACPGVDANGNVDIAPGLTAKITNKGHGRAAVARDFADVHTTLWLYDESAEGGRGTEIWTSGGQQPFQFQLDAGQVIEGWDLGVACMLVGETRELRIAPELGYGARGKPPVPPNATLLFKIELVKLTDPDEPAAG